MSKHLIEVAKTLDEINVQYAWLIEKNTIFSQDILNGYHVVYKQNGKFIKSIMDKVGDNGQTAFKAPEFALLKPFSHPVVALDEHGEKVEQEIEQEEIDQEELALMVEIETALSSIENGFSKIVDNNESASQELKDFYTPHRRLNCKSIKACKHVIQSYM